MMSSNKSVIIVGLFRACVLRRSKCTILGTLSNNVPVPSGERECREKIHPPVMIVTI